jgi:hypothetical protein
MTSGTTASLRSAIVASAVAACAYGLLWAVTTQLKEIRVVVPFGDDPPDLFASVAIILLPLIGGLTAIRVIRYSPSRIPAGPVAGRIVRGLAICLGLISAAVLADIAALVAQPIETGESVGPLVLALVGLTAVTTGVAWVALARGVMSIGVTTAGVTEPEPDALDDLVAVLPFSATFEAKVTTIGDRLRQHRIVAGAGAAVISGVLVVVWHAIREGAWASPVAAAIYGGLFVGILLIAYLALIGPLRVLRSA